MLLNLWTILDLYTRMHTSVEGSIIFVERTIDLNTEDKSGHIFVIRYALISSLFIPIVIQY